MAANFTGDRPFVKISAFWRFVSIFEREIPLLSLIWPLKKWYLTAMCFVRGVIRTEVAMEIALLLYSKTVDQMPDFLIPGNFMAVTTSSKRRLRGMSSRIA
jgi:hypothetical protein